MEFSNLNAPVFQFFGKDTAYCPVKMKLGNISQSPPIVL